MLEWLKWRIAGKEIAELHRWRTKWEEYRRWLTEFPEVSMTLDNMKTEVEGKESLCASNPPSNKGPWDIQGLRYKLRILRSV